MSSSRMRRHSLYSFPQRRQFNNISFLDILPLKVDLLIDELFDQLDLVDRVLTRQQLFQQQPRAFGGQQRFRRPQQQQQRRPRGLSASQQQIRPKQRKNVVGQQQAKTTSRRTNLPFQQKQKQQPFQGRQQQQLKQKKQQFGLQQQQQQSKPFSSGVSGQMSNVNVKGVNKKHQQKYRICIDCRGCDCDPSKLKKTIKCGTNGLWHLTCTAPCISCPTKIFKRSFTLPRQIQRAQMQCTTTPQGHCVLEFPLMGEQPQSLGIDLMPVQKIKTPEGKQAFFAQVPILPIMDPAKVKVCIDGNRLLAIFEHKKIDGCSRVKYCCEVPLPKKNIDISSIICKQNKHTLNITLPVKQQTGGMATMMTGCRDIPVHRKLRHRKQVSGVSGAVRSDINMPSSRGQQQKQPVSSTLSSGIQQQPTQKKQTTQLQQQKQKQKQPQTTAGQSTIDNVLMKPSAATTTTTPDITKKKQKKPKNKPSSALPSSEGIVPKVPEKKKKQHEGVRENIREGVSKGSELLEQVFGFGGKARPSTGEEDKGVQQSESQVKGQVGVDISSSGQKGDISKQQPDITEGSSSTAVSGAVIQ